MKLINAGFGRTGTTSLKGALDMLGYSPSFHSTDLFRSGKDLTFWEQALAGEPVDWRAFFADYAVADWPTALVYKDVIAAHPEAKVMVTVRDPEAWFESINGIVSQLRSIPLPIPHVRRVKRFVENNAVNGIFGGKMEDKAHMVALFEQHIENVKTAVPDGNVLVYDVREGWEPLCNFLEVPVPDKDFPRKNMQGGFRAMAMRIFRSATPG